MGFVAHDNVLTTPQNHLVRLPHPVAEMIDCGDWAIVRLDVPTQSRMNGNVIAFNADGSVRFRPPDVAVPPDADHPYLAITLAAGLVEAYNVNGVLVKANASTGQIVYNELVK